MNLLLDSHILLWSIHESGKLKAKERAAITSPDNVKFVSSASVWELQIKSARGKLNLPPDFEQALEEEPLIELPVTFAHAYATRDLPKIHNDPFDRMLIAQAKMEGLTILTRDPIFKAYGIAGLEG